MRGVDGSQSEGPRFDPHVTQKLFIKSYMDVVGYPQKQLEAEVMINSPMTCLTLNRLHTSLMVGSKNKQSKKTVRCLPMLKFYNIDTCCPLCSSESNFLLVFLLRFQHPSLTLSLSHSNLFPRSGVNLINVCQLI